MNIQLYAKNSKIDSEPVRWMLAYLGLKWSDKVISSEHHASELKLEYSNKNPLIEIPFLVIEDREALASGIVPICKILAASYDRDELFGASQMDKIQVMTLIGVLDDLKNEVLKLYQLEQFSDIENHISQKIEPVLDSLTIQLEERPFLMYYVTIADFLLAFINEIMDDFCKKYDGVVSPFVEYAKLT